MRLGVISSMSRRGVMDVGLEGSKREAGLKETFLCGMIELVGY